VRISVLFAVAFAVVSAGVTATPAAQRRPALTLRTAPLAVRGAHFAPHESLRVVVSKTGRSWTRVVRTTATGTFALSLGFAAPYDACLGPLIVSAAGRTDRATTKVPPRECPPPP
jgi:hypothetical protein